MIKIFKDGDRFAIVTDARNEHEFVIDLSDLLETLIIESDFIQIFEKGKENSGEGYDSIKNFIDASGYGFENDWSFQLTYLLPQIVDICCKLRGYKNNVELRQIMISGDKMIGNLDPMAEHPKGCKIEFPIQREIEIVEEEK